MQLKQEAAAAQELHASLSSQVAGEKAELARLHAEKEAAIRQVCGWLQKHSLLAMLVRLGVRALPADGRMAAACSVSPEACKAHCWGCACACAQLEADQQQLLQHWEALLGRAEEDWFHRLVDPANRSLSLAGALVLPVQGKGIREMHRW